MTDGVSMAEFYEIRSERDELRRRVHQMAEDLHSPQREHRVRIVEAVMGSSNLEVSGMPEDVKSYLGELLNACAEFVEQSGD